MWLLIWQSNPLVNRQSSKGELSVPLLFSLERQSWARLWPCFSTWGLKREWRWAFSSVAELCVSHWAGVYLHSGVSSFKLWKQNYKGSNPFLVVITAPWNFFSKGGGAWRWGLQSRGSADGISDSFTLLGPCCEVQGKDEMVSYSFWTKTPRAWLDKIFVPFPNISSSLLDSEIFACLGQGCPVEINV